MEYALYTEYDRRCTSIYRRSLILFKLCSPTVFGCLGTAPHGSLKGTTTGHGTASYIGGFGVVYESPTQAQQHFDDLWLMFAVEASTRYRTKTSTSPADETAKKVQGSPDKLNERERLHRTTPVRNQGTPGHLHCKGPQLVPKRNQTCKQPVYVGLHNTTGQAKSPVKL